MKKQIKNFEETLAMLNAISEQTDKLKIGRASCRERE